MQFCVSHKYNSYGFRSDERGGYSGLLIAVSLTTNCVSAGDLSD
jgi:hypothetical protein